MSVIDVKHALVHIERLLGPVKAGDKPRIIEAESLRLLVRYARALEGIVGWCKMMPDSDSPAYEKWTRDAMSMSEEAADIKEKLAKSLGATP